MRVSHEQNLILPYVALDDLPAVYDRLASVGLATPNAGAITDIIACPGLDYCALATARSIPIAQRLSEHFGDGARAQGDRPAEDQDLRLHQRLRPSSRRPHRHSRPRARGRGDLSDHARRLGRRDGVDRPDHRAGLQLRERRRRRRDDRRDLYEPAARRRARISFIDLSPRRHGAVQGSALRAQRRIGHLMSAHDVKLFGDQIAASRLEDRFARVKATLAAASGDRGSVPRPHRAGLELRRGFGGAAAYGGAGSTRRRRSSSSTPASIFPRRSPIATRSSRDSASPTSSPPNPTRRRSQPTIRKNSCSPATPTAAATSARCMPLAEALDALRRLDHRPQGIPERRRAPRCRCSRPRASG